MLFDKFQKLRGHRPLILGHRGSPTHAKENTLDSYQAALDAGADGIELDVWETSDHVLVAHHDAELPSGEVISAQPYEVLQHAAQKTGFALPTLEEVFQIVRGRGLCNIELKAAGYERPAVQLAEKILPEYSYAFSSFDARVVWKCQLVSNRITPCFWIVVGEKPAEEYVATMLMHDASGIAYEVHHLTEEATRLFLDNRMPVFVWTVNDVDTAKRLADWGVTGIITDYPDEMRRAF